MITEKIGELEVNTIYCMDCFEGMEKIPNESIDLIVTDPPYGINYKSDHRQNNENVFGIFKNDDNLLWYKNFYDECMRILKNNSFFYACFRFDSLCEIIRLFGNEVKPFQVLIWDKLDYGMGDLSFFSLSYEIILCYKKGNPKLRNYNKRPDGIFRIPKVQSFGSRENKKTGKENQDFMMHPTQKPLELMKRLIQFSSNENDIVLDCFTGGGEVR
jgi:site-specific DNA-methyltransferase (adenine-specific)